MRPVIKVKESKLQVSQTISTSTNDLVTRIASENGQSKSNILESLKEILSILASDSDVLIIKHEDGSMEPLESWH